MDTKPYQIPVVRIDTVGVHLCFSAVPRKTVRVGVEWGGGKAGKHSDSDTEACINRETQREKVKKRDKDRREAMTEVNGMLHLSCIPHSSSNVSFFFSYSFSLHSPFSSCPCSALSVCIPL